MDGSLVKQSLLLLDRAELSGSLEKHQVAWLLHEVAIAQVGVRSSLIHHRGGKKPSIDIAKFRFHRRPSQLIHRRQFSS